MPKTLLKKRERSICSNHPLLSRTEFNNDHMCVSVSVYVYQYVYMYAHVGVWYELFCSRLTRTTHTYTHKLHTPMHHTPETSPTQSITPTLHQNTNNTRDHPHYIHINGVFTECATRKSFLQADTLFDKIYFLSGQGVWAKRTFAFLSKQWYGRVWVGEGVLEGQRFANRVKQKNHTNIHTLLRYTI